MTELLNVRNLSVAYDRRRPVVENLSFSVLPGESVALVGPSGSGKSTCAAALLGLLPPSVSRINGEALFLDAEGSAVDLLRSRPARMRRLRGREIGIIFQEPAAALNPVLSCGVQLREAVARLAPPDVDEETYRHELLARVELEGLESRLMTAMPGQLSGGQLQRLMLAMALAGQPRLLIADEPTTALDCITEAEIVRLLDALRRDQRMGMLFITHDQRLISRVTDRTVRVRAEESSPPTVVLQRGAGKKASDKTEQALPPLIEIDDLHIRFSDDLGSAQAVRGCSFQLGEGEWIGLVGRSGCGKSTVAAWLSGLRTAQSGRLRSQEREIQATAPPRELRAVARAQLIFQDVYGSLNPRLSVRTAIREVMTKRSRERADRLLTSVGLDPERFGDMHAHQLSGGERQRVAIARALASDPRVLICDEVLSGLDVPLRMEVINVLKEVCAARGIGVILITHDLELARVATDRLLLMEDGHIVEEGRTEDVFSQPRTELGRSLLRALRLRQQ